MKTEKSDRLKFYADTPLGDRNKLFSFKVKHIGHAEDLAAMFIQEKGFRIRAAWYVSYKGISTRIDNVTDLSKHENSLILKHDIQRKLELLKQQNQH